MKFIIILILIFLHLQGLAKDLGSGSILSLIDQEINLIKSAKGISPMLKYRLFELNHEKIKILENIYNQNYISGKSTDKSSVKKQFQKTKNIGLQIIKDSPKFKNIANIYYVLGLLEIVHGDKKLASTFLKKSLTLNRNAVEKYHTQVALAEFYYNAKKYHQAIKLYKQIVKNQQDKWYSKHLYNLAWCQYKVNNFGETYKFIKLAYLASSEEQYISIKDQILKSIPTFYIAANRIKEAVAFLSSDSSPIVTKTLLSLAKKVGNSKGNEILTHILKRTLNLSFSRKDYSNGADTYLYWAEINRQQENINAHYKNILNLYKMYKKEQLPEAQQQQVILEVKDYLSYLQYLNKSSFHSSYKSIPKYYKILALIDSKNAHLHYFHLGEFLSSKGDYTNAFRKYALAYNKTTPLLTKSPNARVFLKKLLTSMIHNHELENSSDLKKEIYVFTLFTKHFPREKKSKILFGKLLTNYISLKQLKNAELKFYDFLKHFPKEKKVARALYSEIISYFIKVKDTNSLALWINKENKLNLDFSKKEIKTLTLTLGELLFNSFDKYVKNNEYAKAIASNISLYESNLYPREIKRRAAQNISIYKVKQANLKESFIWLKKTSKLMSNEEVIHNIEYFKNFVILFEELQALRFASLTGLHFLSRTCKAQPEHSKFFFRETLNHFLLTQNDRMVMHLLNFTKKCPSIASLTSFGIRHTLHFSLDFKRPNLLVKIFNSNLELDSKSKELLVGIVPNLYWRINNKDRNAFINKLKVLDISKLNHFISEVETLNKLNLAIDEHHITFFPKVVNQDNVQQQIDLLFQKLDKVTKEMKKNTKSQAPNIVRSSFVTLWKYFDHAYNQLLEVRTSPEIKNELMSVAKQIGSMKNNYRKKGLTLIHSTNEYDPALAPFIFEHSNELNIKRGPSAIHNITPIYRDAI